MCSVLDFRLPLPTGFLCALSLVIFTSTETLSNGDSYCSPSQYNSVSEELISEFDYMTRKIEKLPPNYQTYFRNEEARAASSKNTHLYDTLLNNEFYRPYKIWDTYNSVVGTIKAAMDDSTDPKRRVSMIIYALKHSFYFSNSMESYFEYDKTRREPNFNSKERQDFYTSFFLSTVLIDNLMKCVLNQYNWVPRQ